MTKNKTKLSAEDLYFARLAIALMPIADDTSIVVADEVAVESIDLSDYTNDELVAYAEFARKLRGAEYEETADPDAALVTGLQAALKEMGFPIDVPGVVKEVIAAVREHDAATELDEADEEDESAESNDDSISDRIAQVIAKSDVDTVSDDAFDDLVDNLVDLFTETKY